MGLKGERIGKKTRVRGDIWVSCSVGSAAPRVVLGKMEGAPNGRREKDFKEGF